jgi:hypothetical protein
VSRHGSRRNVHIESTANPAPLAVRLSRLGRFRREHGMVLREGGLVGQEDHHQGSAEPVPREVGLQGSRRDPSGVSSQGSVSAWTKSRPDGPSVSRTRSSGIRTKVTWTSMDPTAPSRGRPHTTGSTPPELAGGLRIAGADGVEPDRDRTSIFGSHRPSRVPAVSGRRCAAIPPRPWGGDRRLGCSQEYTASWRVKRAVGHCHYRGGLIGDQQDFSPRR